MKFYKLDKVTQTDIDNFKLPNIKIGVIAHIEDLNGNILLQKRGIKSRDENGKYEDIGGKVEKDDDSFKSAIEREIIEEAGCDVKINLSDELGIYHVKKQDINWLFIIYFGKYLGGEFKIMEPTKCEGYKFFSYTDMKQSSDVTESSKVLTKKIKEYC